MHIDPNAPSSTTALLVPRPTAPAVRSKVVGAAVKSAGSLLYDRFDFTRPFLASAWGYRLRWRRYGRGTERIVAEALERETWAPEKLRTWQQQRLCEVLHHAATKVPYYRSYWQERRRRGDFSSWEDIANWPILEKSPIRENPRAFLAEDRMQWSLCHEITSGTTGAPIHLWFTKEAVRAWYGLAEARWRNWYGLSRQDRWALLGAQIVVPIEQTEPPFWVWNAGLNQLYCSTYHLRSDVLRHYLDALVRYRVRYLWGHSSALFTLASEAARIGFRGQLAAVLSSSEPLTRVQRRMIATAFKCPVRETYGMTEMAAAASECEHGRLHAWPEIAHLELLADATEGDRPAHLISTCLVNPAMPLIRYRTGDLAARVSDCACPCGRTLPVLGGILGRFSDILLSPDFRQLPPSAMEAVFDDDIRISEAQIIQDELTALRIRYVPADGFGEADAAKLVERVRQRMGEVSVTLERVDSIPRGPNGKFRAVLSRLDSKNTSPTRAVPA
jgi:phenylacetate-CoA ligase